MHITIKELMQLKNEVAHTIQKHQRTLAYPTGLIEYGIETINDDHITKPHDTTPFPDFYERYQRLLLISEQLHDALATASNELGINSLVRSRQNNLALIQACESALKHSKPYNQRESINVAGGGKETVTKTYQPHITSATLKARIRELKGRVRAAQTAIDEGNTRRVEVPHLTRAAIEELLDA